MLALPKSFWLLGTSLESERQETPLIEHVNALCQFSNSYLAIKNSLQHPQTQLNTQG